MTQPLNTARFCLMSHKVSPSPRNKFLLIKPKFWIISVKVNTHVIWFVKILETMRIITSQSFWNLRKEQSDMPNPLELPKGEICKLFLKKNQNKFASIWTKIVLSQKQIAQYLWGELYNMKYISSQSSYNNNNLQKLFRNHSKSARIGEIIAEAWSSQKAK